DKRCRIWPATVSRRQRIQDFLRVFAVFSNVVQRTYWSWRHHPAPLLIRMRLIVCLPSDAILGQKRDRIFTSKNFMARRRCDVGPGTALQLMLRFNDQNVAARGSRRPRGLTVFGHLDKD